LGFITRRYGYLVVNDPAALRNWMRN
jgi:hypothetical protein